jgi:hypothetical protein
MAATCYALLALADLETKPSAEPKGEPKVVAVEAKAKFDAKEQHPTHRLFADYYR